MTRYWVFKCIIKWLACVSYPRQQAALVIISHAVRESLSMNSIFQISSGLQFPCGVAVLRVSGPSCSRVAQLLTRKSFLGNPREMRVASLFNPETGRKIDHRAMLVRFASPASFTGEDVLEIHCHGNAVVVRSLMRALADCSKHGVDIREAEAGEFTRRAFYNGKLDLTQIEGLSDLLACSTELQRDQALRQVAGDLRTLYLGWRTRLIGCLAYFEAVIDFSDDAVDGDVDEAVIENNVTPKVRNLLNDISEHLEDGGRGEVIRDGISLCFAGETNVGKSSLMNRVCKKEVAIVADIHGTTRDVVESHTSVAGVLLLAADTAGTREAGDEVELEGMKRAKAKYEASQLKLMVIGPYTTPVSTDATLIVVNKWDTVPEKDRDSQRSILEKVFGDRLCVTSCVDENIGISELNEKLEGLIKSTYLTDEDQQGKLALTRERHRILLERCSESLENYMAQRHHRDYVLLCEELRCAIKSLGKIVGVVDVEEVLDVIFTDFCIGK